MWAHFLVDVAVKIVSPVEHIIPMKRTEKGYWKLF
jgi:maltooligosyltrehalose trehalohydrolase